MVLAVTPCRLVKLPTVRGIVGLSPSGSSSLAWQKCLGRERRQLVEMDVTPARQLTQSSAAVLRKFGHPRNRDVHYRTHNPPQKTRHLCHVIDKFGSSCKVTVSNLGPQTGCPELKCNLLGCLVQWFERPQFSSWTSMIFFLATASTPAVGPQNCLSSDCRLLLN